uniref:Uncharacterized protein n=1 Tax=Arundo donax TaxID=35708 RepID=A0A0A9HP45_ARUDO
MVLPQIIHRRFSIKFIENFIKVIPKAASKPSLISRLLPDKMEHLDCDQY